MLGAVNIVFAEARIMPFFRVVKVLYYVDSFRHCERKFTNLKKYSCQAIKSR